MMRRTRNVTLVVLVALATCAVANAEGTRQEIVKETARRLLLNQEKYAGRMMLYPDVVGVVGALRYAELTGDEQTIERIRKRYEAAYPNSKYNELSYGHLEDQVTVVVPLELYRLTGDKSLLAHCRMVVEGQRAFADKNGLYRHHRYLPEDVVMLGVVQALGGGAFGDRAALDFGVRNVLEAFGRVRLEETAWETGPGAMAASMAELLRVTPADHRQRGELVAAFKKVMDPNARPKLYARQKSYNIPEDIGSGISKLGAFELGYWMYAAASGVREGVLDKSVYGKAIDEGWDEIRAAFKMKLPYAVYPDGPFLVLYRPYQEWGGVMMALAAKASLEGKVTPKKAVEVPLEEGVAMTQEQALSLWATLRAAGISGDACHLDAAAKQYRRSADGKRQIAERRHRSLHTALVGMEICRLTGNRDVQNGVEWKLDRIAGGVENPPEAGMAALAFAQAYLTYGPQSHLQQSRKWIEKTDDVGLRLLTLTTLLEGATPGQPALAELRKQLTSAITSLDAPEAIYAVTTGLRRNWFDRDHRARYAGMLLEEPAAGEPIAALAEASLAQWRAAQSQQKQIDAGKGGDLEAAIAAGLDAARAEKILADSQGELTSQAMFSEGAAYAALLAEDGSLADKAAGRFKQFVDTLQGGDGLFRPARGRKATARSTGEALLGVSLLLRALPEDCEQKPYVVWAIQKAGRSPERCQDPQGLWHVTLA